VTGDTAARVEAPAAAAVAPSSDPLERMARGDDPFDEATALAAWTANLGAGRALEGIEWARRLFAEGFTSERLRLEVARALDARGDEAGALATLEPLLARGTSAAAFALAGDAHERRGERVAARRAYERALSIDVDRPGIRERLAALADEPEIALHAGATLTTEGATAERYRIERQVGRGGAGAVFAAYDVSLGRRVALKIYHQRGPVERARLESEAKTAAALAHPGVVRVFDLSPALCALAMEWLPGGSVDARIARGEVGVGPGASAPLEPRHALSLMRSAAEAVAFVHARGVVHRDLKPSNFLLRPSGRVVLTDFGLALPEGATPPRPGEGSVGYMPREQREGRAADARSDVYALGVSFRAMWPFEEPLPGRLSSLVERCLDEAPEARPPLAELLSELESVTGPSLAEDPPSR
jgi:serine/threonine-protein kinase